MPFPCDGHGSGPSGPVRGFYAALVDDGTRLSAYKRYCPNCLMVLMKDHRSDWQPGYAIDAPEQSTACTSCGTVADKAADLRPFYVTTWTVRNQRLDYFAHYCADCAQVVIGLFGLKEHANGRI